jgi:hypothetical protein
LAKALAGKASPVISTLRFAKEAAISTYKIADPKGYRRNRVAKFIDKHL